MKKIKRTDMALEFGLGTQKESEDSVLTVSKVVVDKEFGRRTGKALGTYFTVETTAVREGNRDAFSRIAEELGGAIRKLSNSGSCLVVGLGNPDLTADSLGKRVLDRILITRHFMSKDKQLATVSGIAPNVLGVTGIESFDIVKGVTERIKPELVLAVDSLAAAAAGRIASAFQVSDAGITPGSGVSNHRTRLDKKSLGCSVLSIGVPLVVYASTLIEDATGKESGEYDQEIGSMIVTPKDIDMYVTDCAEIIARSINYAFFGE